MVGGRRRETCNEWIKKDKKMREFCKFKYESEYARERVEREDGFAKDIKKKFDLQNKSAMQNIQINS
jgi:hypothetical protein